jgi:hypothetical protein
MVDDGPHKCPESAAGPAFAAGNCSHLCPLGLPLRMSPCPLKVVMIWLQAMEIWQVPCWETGFARR